MSMTDYQKLCEIKDQQTKTNDSLKEIVALLKSNNQFLDAMLALHEDEKLNGLASVINTNNF